jgi:hypothetical protein
MQSQKSKKQALAWYRHAYRPHVSGRFVNNYFPELYDVDAVLAKNRRPLGLNPIQESQRAIEPLPQPARCDDLEKFLDDARAEILSSCAIKVDEWCEKPSTAAFEAERERQGKSNAELQAENQELRKCLYLLEKYAHEPLRLQDRAELHRRISKARGKW